MRLNLYFVVVVLILISHSCEKSIGVPLIAEGGGVYDYDNNFYKTVILGDQEWTTENLKTTHFCNGELIPNTGDSAMVKMYNNDPLIVDTFGRHYNYQAVQNSAGLCPCNWHVATEKDFQRLIAFLGGNFEAMKKLKKPGTRERGTGLWRNLGVKGNDGTNESDFSALPAGVVFYSKSILIDTLTNFWADSQNDSVGYYFSIGGTSYIGRQTVTVPTSFYVTNYSIRCVKDL